jgi:hypothetical protein
MKDSRGYSLRLYRQIQNAPSDHLGVRLGKACIERALPASAVGGYFGVSKPTIYSWFCGKSMPRKKHHEKIFSILDHGGLDAEG